MTRGQALNLAEWFNSKGQPAIVAVTRDPSLPLDAPTTYAVSSTVINGGPNALSALQILMTEVNQRGLAARVEISITVADPV